MANNISSIGHLFLYVSLIIITQQNTNSLKINLILPNSQDSPIFFGNLTTFKKIQFLQTQSENSITQRFLSKTTILPGRNSSSLSTSNFLRSPVGSFGDTIDNFSLLYFAKIGIGSFKIDNDHNFTSYYLFAVDTGSALTWLQCEACKVKPNGRCFPSINPPFKNSRSSTYKPLKKHNGQCIIPKENVMDDDEFCDYFMGYADDSMTSGVLAREAFTFESDTNSHLTISDVLFGCGIKQIGFPTGKPLPISGILGLDHEQGSLPVQLDPSGVELSVSYCPPNLIEHTNVTTYLKIGDDMLSSYEGYHHTPLLLDDDGSYHVKMFDIRVNGQPLHIPPSAFGDAAGGVFFDSGSSLTSLADPAYIALERYLVKIFSTNKNYVRRPKNDTLPLLCYDMIHAEGYTNLPSMSFMLLGSVFEIGPEQAFIVAKGERSIGPQEYFCLLMSHHRMFWMVLSSELTNK